MGVNFTVRGQLASLFHELTHLNRHLPVRSARLRNASFLRQICMTARAEVLIEQENGAIPDAAECHALIDRVARSSQFARSARLREFLLYVGHESLKPDAAEMHEQEIGIHV